MSYTYATSDWQMNVEPHQYHQAHVLVHVTNSSERRLETSDFSCEATKGRRTKAPTLRDSDWEPHKHRIRDLHIVQDKPLKEVKQIMHEQFNFSAEIRQYRSRISKWKLDKNIKSDEMKCIVKKRQHRKFVESKKPELMFRVRGNLVEPAKVQRWMDRHDVPESMIYAPSPVASTPSAISYYTTSAVASPAPSWSSSTSTSTGDYFLLEWINDSAYSTPEQVPPCSQFESQARRSSSSGFTGIIQNHFAPGNSMSGRPVASRANSDEHDAFRAFREFVFGPFRSEKHGFIYRKLEAEDPTLFVAVSRSKLNRFVDETIRFYVYGSGLPNTFTLTEFLDRMFIRRQGVQYCLVHDVNLVRAPELPLCFKREYCAMVLS
ncbi:Clr5 domain-containing protein [Paraphoma chrysanthemicola]|nr:Clr5 domain-containing protein [Paraphoma chrysanthemicola]